jgi:beta-lactamase regulating signal transducer with metallopeptidase domain
MTEIVNSSLPSLVERTGWMLIHSVWQFALLGLVLFAAEKILARRSAAVRYVVAASALCLMVSCAVGTFCVVDVRNTADSTANTKQVLSPATHEPDGQVNGDTLDNGLLLVVSIDDKTTRLKEWDRIPEHPTDRRSESASNGSAASIGDGGHDDRSSPHLDAMGIAGLANRLRPWLPVCVIVWFVGMAVAGLRLIAGGWNVRRLRRRGLSPVSEEIHRILEVIAPRLGVQRAVAITQSSLVAGPVVIGWLKPLILLPMTSLTGLTSEQLEAVLAHELAHVRRLDYVVNLAQTVVETVFFYHPAVWWVSRRMRIHREDCCDDRAVSVVSTPVSYASALLRLYELQGGGRVAASSASVVALPVTGGSLKKRIHRVLGLDDTLQSAPGWWLSTSIVGSVLLFVGCGLMAQTPGSEDTGLGATTESREALTLNDATGERLLPSPDSVGENGTTPSVPLPPAIKAEDRKQVLQQLSSLGVSPSHAFNVELNSKRIPNVYNAELFNVPEAAWPLLGRLYTIRRLGLTASRVSPEAFRHIGGIRGLEHLEVMNSRFEPKHLEALAPLKQLKSLDVMLSLFQLKSEVRQAQLGELSEKERQRFDEIAGPDRQLDHIAQAAILTDRALLKLSELKELRTLRLVNTFVSNAGVLSLGEKQQLEKVEISVGGKLTPGAAAVFGKMPKLEELFLLGMIDAQAAESLKAATALERLELRSIDDDVASVIAELPQLSWLRLWANSLSDDGLMELAALKTLTHLDIRNSFGGSLTPSGIERFQAARPGCAVVHDVTVESLSERKIPLPADHFMVRLHWRKATSRQQLAEHMETRFGESEYWVEFRPLTRAGYVGGIALVRGGEAGRDWLFAQTRADGDYDVDYSEPISYQRLKNEGVLFDALLKPTGGSTAADTAESVRHTKPSATIVADTATSAPKLPDKAFKRESILLPGESLPPFQQVLARLRERGRGKTADSLQTRFELEKRWMVQRKRKTNSGIAYGQVVVKSGEPPQLCNAPMKIFEGGWFVAGIGDLDRPVGFRMAGCRLVDVVPSKVEPGVQPGSVVSLGQIVMEPYAKTELVKVRGRLKFSGDKVPGGIRARIIIRGGPTNSVTGGTDGSMEWPEKENVTLADDLRFEHRRLSPLPHTLFIETPGYLTIIRDLELNAGSTLDLGTIEIDVAPKFRVEFVASDTTNFAESKLRSVTVPLGEVWKSNPDNEALRKYSGGDMRFTTFPVDRKEPDGKQKLVIHSGVASQKLADLGTGDLEAFRDSSINPPRLRYSRDVVVQSGHVYLGYHTHWKHWTLLRVTIE